MKRLLNIKASVKGFWYFFAKDESICNPAYYVVEIQSGYPVYSGCGTFNKVNQRKSYFICKPSDGYVSSDDMNEATWYSKESAEECANNFNRMYRETRVNDGHFLEAKPVRIGFMRMLIWSLRGVKHVQHIPIDL